VIYFFPKRIYITSGVFSRLFSLALLHTLYCTSNRVTQRLAAQRLGHSQDRIHAELVLMPNLLEQLLFGPPVHHRLRSGLLPAPEYSVLPTMGQFKLAKFVPADGVQKTSASTKNILTTIIKLISLLI
jgi:hypothetical protein